ncbi:MAG TPA: alpha/beta fold hydrolase [Solirubrobacterales bacterium]|jgi:lipase|nr:alpha/beta fold hydrolase [Solirubrobacterales bacterium]
MILKAHRWGAPVARCVVCLHGLTHHGGVFAELGSRLASSGYSVIAFDLRGHGDSAPEPPWDLATHVDDFFDTLEAEGVRPAAWIGHSFGGRLAAEAAVRRPEFGAPLVMLEPGLHVPPKVALRSAETERLDWSFATLDGAVEAILAAPTTLAAPREVVAAFVRDDVRKGPDGRYRFRFSPAAAVVAWSEMATPPPPIARCPTLLVMGKASVRDDEALDRYAELLGSSFSFVEVPHGHNMLWEAPGPTIEAIERFLGSAMP